jgi:hypothetical protein
MSDAKHWFFQLGTQYYVAGRYACFAYSNPVAANLLHHAVEMFLKGELSRSIPLKKLKEDLGHRLPKIWDEFKIIAPSLSAFDAVVAKLQKFEDIRYPNRIMSDGMSSDIGITFLDGSSLTIDHSTQATTETPRYWLQLEEVDQLVAVIFEVARCNLPDYLPRFAEAENSFVYRENRHFRPSDSR